MSSKSNWTSDGPIRRKLRMGRRQRGAEIGRDRHTTLCTKGTNHQTATHNHGRLLITNYQLHRRRRTKDMKKRCDISQTTAKE